MGIGDTGRQLIQLLELDLDRCTRTFGVSPCTAGIENSGTATAGGATSITLAAGASAADDAYNTMTARITGGTGSGQERIVSDYVGATKVATVSVAWTTIPDATSTYTIIDRPNACYNTFRTCQDTANYAKAAKTYRFCGRGAPIAAGELLRPYLMRLSAAATEIDPEKGLAVRSKVSVTLADETDNDTEQDPYVTDRATPAGGTFWTRLIARNLATAGRSARVKRLYIDPGATYTLADAGWVSELYVIDAINGPDKTGAVQIVIKDPLKLTDRQKLPAPSDGELSVAMTASDVTLTLKSGQGAQYGNLGYIRVGEEVIEFTTRVVDVLSWPNTTYRGKFGTVAATHAINDRVQLCQAWLAASVSTVLEEMLNAADILDANIDLAGIATEVADWYGTYSITLCLTEPETISKLIEELCATVQGLVWWSAVDQKVKFKAMRPLSPLSTAPALLTDEANFIEDSVQITREEPNRLTQVAVWYGLISATSTKDDWQSYKRAYVAVDPNAESANEYNDVRQKTFYARFLDETSGQAAAELAIRFLLWRRDAPIVVNCKLDPKDTQIQVGEQADVETFGLVDFDGDIQRQRVLVTKRQDNGVDVAVTLLVTFLSRRYLWITPDAQPDYGAATIEERRFGYISDDSGKLSDGSDGHVIV